MVALYGAVTIAIFVAASIILFFMSIIILRNRPKVLEPTQGLVLKSPSHNNNLIKMWIDENKLCFRVSSGHARFHRADFYH